MKCLLNLKNSRSKSFLNNSENCSEFDLLSRKSNFLDQDYLNKMQKISSNNEKTSIKPIEGDYTNSLFSKFYLLNDQKEFNKCSESKGEREEEFLLPAPKSKLWYSSVFSCCINSQNE